MKRCRICKKIIWWWQLSFGGRKEEHKKCDYSNFCFYVDKIVNEGNEKNDYFWGLKQKILRRQYYY